MNKILLILFFSLFSLAGCQEKAPADTAKEAGQNVAKVVAEKATETITEKKADHDEESGLALHQANCARCHGEGYYPKKPKSSMNSYDDLHKRVRMCNAQLGTELFPEELQKIGDYLNDSFYKFSK